LPVQLFEADGIDTIISTGGVVGGAPPNPQLVGESYSLNFLSNIPPIWEPSGLRPAGLGATRSPKDIVTIAVLDTGIDPFIVDKGYTSSNLKNVGNLPCYERYRSEGWNFVAGNQDIEDDNPGRHGSLVTQFIINEFKKNPKKRLRIIPVKTHDSSGEGDLFKILCAIYYAIAKGANIINASWGFYYYNDYNETPIEALDLVIKNLKELGILFITAAGNKIDQDDALASGIYHSRFNVYPNAFQLRDLAVHQFLPGTLSQDNSNVITVTTTNGTQVAYTENHSEIFVDIGVINDEVEQDGDLSFNVPFKQVAGSPNATVKGSSFATAIVTGFIGANCSLSDISKADKKSLIKKLGAQVFPALIPLLIKDGICIKK
jgi:hypothetical protein